MSRFLQTARSRSERGYVLLMMMLFVALLAIGAAALAPSITLQVRRDREEEMIHRGVQYSRAIRHYVKKFGRYPTRIEELENTNNLRFLRKRYKDPITGEDFKLLHLGEVQLVSGARIAGATPVGQQPGAPQGPAAIAAQAQGVNPGNPQNQPQNQDADSQNGQNSGDKLSSQVFGGGPIVGVVSVSKDKTVRELNKKNHYNDWQFIYDPSTDRGGLLNTPAQPPLQNAVPNVQQGPGGVPPGAIGIQVQNPQQPDQQASQPPQ